MTTASHPSAEAERLSRIVADAWSATSPVADEVDQATRQAAFKLVLETMLQNGAEQLGAPDEWADEPPGQTAREALDDALATEVQRTDAVATALGLEYGDVGALFDLSAAEPVLHVNPTKLAPDDADVLREITLLVCIGRGALGLATGTRHIREAAAAHDRLDAVNFNAEMERIPGIALRGHSDSDNRFVGLRGAGFEAAGDLARRLVCE